MLPFRSLDTETFSQILEKARKSINIYDPSWTDENYHDPGITIMELFAWLKEMQQFYINQMGFGNFSKYIKLLGGGILHARPAYAKADIVSRDSIREYEAPADGGDGPETAEELYVIPKGTRAYADGIAFETAYSRYIGMGGSQKPDDVCLISTGEFLFEMEQGKRIKCYPFGRECLPESAFMIYFNKPLAKDRQAELEFEIFEDYAVKRNPITGSFFELADLTWEYSTAEGWLPIEPSDNTHGLIISGSMGFTPRREMTPLENGKYALRCTLKSAAYDVAPLINNISLNTIRLRQTYTLSEQTDITAASDSITMYTYLSIYGSQEIYVQEGEGYVKKHILSKEPDAVYGLCDFRIEGLPEQARCKVISYEEAFAEKRNLGFATGLPYQSFEIDLGEQAAYYDSFELATVAAAPTDGEVLFEWQKVDDFDFSGKYDRHYILDENTGKIIFGDGVNGMCPVGRVLITQLSLTRGKGGNVKRRQIDTLYYANSALTIRNDNHAYGGAHKERFEDAITRLRMGLGDHLRAVSKTDYERIVLNTPGLMIENAIAYSPDKHFINQHECSPTAVVIAVKPFSEKPYPRLSEEYVGNIRANLEKYRLLGTQVIIQSPEYINIEIYVDLSVTEYYQNAQEAVKESVRSFFVKEYGGFGALIQYDSIYGIIDTHEAVKGISALIINAKGNNLKREDNGNIILPENGLGYLKTLHFTVK